MTPDQLAALGRALGYNDPQNGGGTGEGDAEDHNVELLVSDPNSSGGGSPVVIAARPRLKVTVSPRRVRSGRRTRYRFRVTSNGRAVRIVRRRR